MKHMVLLAVSLGALAGCDTVGGMMPWHSNEPAPVEQRPTRIASSSSASRPQVQPAVVATPHVAPAQPSTAPAPAVAAPRPPPPPPPTVTIAPASTGGTAPQSLDTTTEAEKQEALNVAPPAESANLGRAVVALGAPSEGGLWVASPNVTTRGQGQVVAPNGQTLQVELRPSTGASTMSLGAYQALGIGLTELPEVEIRK